MHMLSMSRPCMGGMCYLHYKYFEDIATQAGFQVLHSGCMHPPNVPPELLTLEKEHTHFGRIQYLIQMLTACRILPEHMSMLMQKLRSGGHELVEMERQKLLTMNWDYVFYKPHIPHDAKVTKILK